MKLKADSTTNASTSDQRAFQVTAQTVEALQHQRDEIENAKDGKEKQVRGITSMNNKTTIGKYVHINSKQTVQ